MTSRQRRLLSAVAIIVALFTSVWLFSGNSLEQRLLEVHVEDFSQALESKAEIAARRELQRSGTNALPLLLKWMNAPPPKYSRLHQVIWIFRPARGQKYQCWLNNHNCRAEAALWGLKLLGTNASPVAADLGRMADTNPYAYRALMFVGSVKDIERFLDKQAQRIPDDNGVTPDDR